MTGFGHGESRDPKLQMVLEIRSYNNRFLELSINLPYSLKQLEPRVREFLSARIQRGKVEFYLSSVELEEGSEVLVDHARVRSYMAALEELRRTMGTREKPGLAHVIGLDGVLKTVSRKDPESSWAALLPLLEKVFADFDASRATEGAKLKQTFEDWPRISGRSFPLLRRRFPKSRKRSGKACGSVSASSWARGSTSRGSSRKRQCSWSGSTSMKKSSG